jgi:hypothetical protein
MEDWKYGRMEVLKHFTANCQLPTANKKIPLVNPEGRLSK